MLNDEKFLNDPRRAVQLGLGIVSPLWPTFIAATSAGVAFWAWSRWLRGKAQSEFAPALAGSAAPVEPVAPPPVPEPIPAPIVKAAQVATKAAENSAAATAEAGAKAVAPVARAVSEAIGSSAAVLAPAEIVDPIELTPEALAAEAAISEVAQAPLAEAARPARRKRAEAAPSETAEAAPEPEAEAQAPPARKPPARPVAATPPRKVRAKADGQSAPAAPKRRRVTPRGKS